MARINHLIAGAATCGSPRGAFSELWVCFEPPATDLPPYVLVLSFMSPSAEAAMHERWSAQMLSGRILVNEVRSRGRQEYVGLIARVAATPCVGGRTLRQALGGPAGYSRWWFLDITEKDCVSDDDTIYVTILRLMAVQAVKDEYGIKRVELRGGDPLFAAALGREGTARESMADIARAIGFGVLGRLALIAEYVGLWWKLRTLPVPPSEQRDVLLQAYWDWTVRPDINGNLQDRYFTNLPAQLAGRGLRTGWLASCEPSAEHRQFGRKKRDVVAASCAHPEVTLLERYLTLADILRAAWNLRYPIQATRFVIDRRFRSLCRIGTFNLYPLVRKQLLRAVWGGTFCRLQLVATATARACRQLRPKMVLTCFELFLRSRAIYAGVRACSPRVAVWAAQHAGYSSDKTLGVFDPEIEVRGIPDGCAMPVPDGIFALGDLSRSVWEASGFAPGRVVLTGGLRYQTVRIEPPVARESRSSASVLLVGGMHEGTHMELCEAALAATSGLPVRLQWRDHPSYLFSQRPAFRRFSRSITVTTGTLDEDLRTADLVLFTQSGVGEEALLRGIPTWQWLWAGFNISPFVDLPLIPTFTSVAALRLELESFLRDVEPYQPAAEIQQRVLYECFGPDPGGASARIADAVHDMIAADAAA